MRSPHLSLRSLHWSAFMIKIAPADAAADKVKRKGIQRVNDWLEELLPDDERDEEFGGSAPIGKETTISVNQLACKEPGCPDVEVVMILRRAKPREKLMFKIFKAAADISREEVVAALEAAMAEEQANSVANDDEMRDSKKSKTNEQQHEHNESTNDHDHADGGCGEGCCDHDHAGDGVGPVEHDHKEG